MLADAFQVRVGRADPGAADETLPQPQEARAESQQRCAVGVGRFVCLRAFGKWDGGESSVVWAMVKTSLYLFCCLSRPKRYNSSQHRPADKVAKTHHLGCAHM